MVGDQESDRQGFHSTGFPYEVGINKSRLDKWLVSIQLVSPTRGDLDMVAGYFDPTLEVSIQLVSPTRGDSTDSEG